MNRTLVIVPITTQAEDITWPSFKKNVLDVLKADLALCIQTPENYDDTNPYWQFAKYRWTTPKYEDWNSLLDEAQGIELERLKRKDRVDWRQLFALAGNWLGAAHDGEKKRPGSGVILIYFRWLLHQYLVAENLLNQYDRFIITRADFFWQCPHPPLEFLSPDKIWLGDGESWGGISDRHTVLSRQNIEAYLGIGSQILTDPDGLLAEMRFRSEWNIEQYIAHSLARLGLRDQVAYFPYAMYLVRAKDAGPTWSPGQWNEALGYFIKYPNELASAQELANIIQSPSDWQVFFVGSNHCLFKALVLNSDGNALAFDGEKYTPIDVKAIGTFYIDALLIDCLGSTGRLYVGQSKYGEHIRAHIADVEIEEVNNGAYILKTLGQNSYYGVDQEGRLVTLDEPVYQFQFANRYLMA